MSDTLPDIAANVPFTSTSKSKQPIHGNYWAYYNKRPSLCDPRLSLFEEDFFKQKTILDVGCNEGRMSCELAQRWGAEKVVGVDIDEELVRAAWKRRRIVWSAQARTSPPQIKKRKRHSESVPNKPAAQMPLLQANYFPASLAHTFGPLAIPTTVDDTDTPKFPHNVSFRAADWAATGVLEDAQGYDIVIAFSVSKWIHLNDGDEGIKSFFGRVYASLRSGGTFLLEPQAWEGYTKAKRMDQKLKDNAKALLIRPEDFGVILKSIGFSPGRRVGIVGEGGFHRPIDAYQRPD